MVPRGLVDELFVVAPEDGPFVDQPVHLGLQMGGDGCTGPDVVQLAPETVEVALDQPPPRQDRFTIGREGHGPSIGSADRRVTEQCPAPSGGSLRPDLTTANLSRLRAYHRAMSRRPDPERVYTARREATAGRLRDVGLPPSTVAAWLDAWERIDPDRTAADCRAWLGVGSQHGSPTRPCSGRSCCGVGLRDSGHRRDSAASLVRIRIEQFR
jgi:hypothetical protein